MAMRRLLLGETSHDRKLSSGSFLTRWPGDLLVVALAGAQTSVQDPDEAIRAGAERLMVRLAARSLAS
jgi:hypothetical protein